jgi:hypothetical protein
MDLSIQKQRHRALVAGSAGILMQPRMESGHRRQGLNQQEDTEAKGTNTAFHGAQQPSGRRWHHGREYATAAVPLQQFFLPVIRQ